MHMISTDNLFEKYIAIIVKVAVLSFFEKGFSYSMIIVRIATILWFEVFSNSLFL